MTQAIDLISEVKELQGLNSKDISKLLKENENFPLLHFTENGSTLQVEMDKLVRFLPLHLTAVLLSSHKDEGSLRYILSGLRLLYSFCQVASRHPKLEQILLDDVRVSEELLDLVVFVLIFCACKQGNHSSGVMPLLYAAIVTCSMYLLTACISSQWNELAFVLHAHPKFDVFIDAAFGAVRRNISFLQTNFSADDYTLHSDPSLAAEKVVYFYCQQCEASLQFLQQICQNNLFRERLLKNKELCGKGGVLRLAQAALKLKIPSILKESCAVIAAFSRLKARVLSMLLNLCEEESVPYLDEVASIPESFDLAKSVALEVVCLLKTMLSREVRRPENHSGKTYPMGLLQINALRLADIFSDDSNFRSYVTIHFAEVLATILSVPYQQFLSSWCSSNLPLKEEDNLLVYEPFTVAGWVLGLSSPSDIINVEICESNFIPLGSAEASYAHQRTSLLVKVIANLHCFVPKICKEQEKNLLLHKFIGRLNLECQDLPAGYSFPSQPCPQFTSNVVPQKAAAVCKNLRSLLGHAESLIPTFLNEEDVQLLRVFFTQLQPHIGLVDLEVNRALELKNAKNMSSSIHGGTEFDGKSRNSNLREGMSDNSAFAGVYNPCMQYVGEVDCVMQDGDICEHKSSKASPERFAVVEKAETSGSELSSTGGKNLAVQVGNGKIPKSSEHSSKSNVGGSQEGERVESLNCVEKQVRKRRAIMNDIQISLFERAVQEDPGLHKKAASVQSWADRLSGHGPEVTSTQLKSWLYNRKSKLARTAGKGSRVSSKDSPIGDKQDVSTTQPSFDRNPPEQKQLPTTGRTSLGANLSCNLEILGPESSTRINTQYVSTTQPSFKQNPPEQKQFSTSGRTSLGANLNRNLEIAGPESSTRLNTQYVSTTQPSCKQNPPEQKQLSTARSTSFEPNLSRILEIARSQSSSGLSTQYVSTTLPSFKQNPPEQRQLSTTARTSLQANLSQSLETARTESSTRLNTQNGQISNSNCRRFEEGQAVVLRDPQGKVMAKGTVLQVDGEYNGCSLKNSNTCVVDVSEIRPDRIMTSPHPSIEGDATFEEAEFQVYKMKAVWKFSEMHLQ